MTRTQKTICLGPLASAVESAAAEFQQADAFRRIWKHDPSLWKNEENHQKVIRNRLGWLKSSDWLLTQKKNLLEFQAAVKQRKFTHAVLLGMGGSSLAPELLCRTFKRSKGFPEFTVLDSTDSDQVLHVRKTVDLKNTLFIVSTKSGTTLETVSFFRYFFQEMKALKGDQSGENFVAITDPGTPLEKQAKDLSFWRVFVNPADVGGRFSVMSFFGFVPAAVMGLPLEKLLDRLNGEQHKIESLDDPRDNLGVLLGLAMAEAVKAGRDKLTLILSSEVKSFGLWIEQLLAESLGKDGKGVVPIVNEAANAGKSQPRTDRFYVFLACGKSTALSQQFMNVSKRGEPGIFLQLKDAYDVAAQFYFWSFATAVAGIRFGINPFDEPNVQSAKDMTNFNLSYLKEHGRFPERPIHVLGKAVNLTFGVSAFGGASPIGKTVQDFLRLVRPGDYINVAAYLPYTAPFELACQKLTLKLHQMLGVAAMFGFGPRYLHSTGQLHKGGPNNCVMVLLTADPAGDAAIPGESFSFAQLEHAQALGDFRALDEKGRRVAHCHLAAPVKKALDELIRLF